MASQREIDLARARREREFAAQRSRALKPSAGGSVRGRGGVESVPPERHKVITITPMTSTTTTTLPRRRRLGPDPTYDGR
jgi:hypothetical protein